MTNKLLALGEPDFAQFMAGQWKMHTKQPQVVQDELRKLQVTTLSESELIEVGALACHVHGEHLGDWAAGVAYIESLATSRRTISDATRQRLWRQRAILLKASHDICDLEILDAADRFHVLTLATPAAVLMGDPTYAATIYTEALALLALFADVSEPERLFGVMTANLTCDLIERPDLLPQQQSILLTLAEKSYAIWQRIGDEKDKDKAWFRLTQSYIAARKPVGYGSGRYARSSNIAS
jgi:hypothetical protein